MASDEHTSGFEDDLFDMLPEGTRIIIRGNQVTFENLTPELLDVALSLNPGDADLKARCQGVAEPIETWDQHAPACDHESR